MVPRPRRLIRGLGAGGMSLVLGGCLERVTGENVPLDPRFTAGHVEDQSAEGDPNGMGEKDGVYVGYEGATIHVTGVVLSATSGPVQIDVNEPDDTSPSKTKRVGALHLPEPGAFTMDVPADRTEIQIQAFQDPDVDGPSEQDPFCQLTLPLASVTTEPITLELVVGARGNPAGDGGAPPAGDPAGGEGATGQPVPAPPGAPGGDPSAAPPGGGAPGPPAVFPAGPKVAVSGTVSATLDSPISVDFFKVDETAPGGRTFLFKLQATPGAWSTELPEGFGQVQVDAYQDPGGDGPSEGDPMFHYDHALMIGSEPITGIVLVVP